MILCLFIIVEIKYRFFEQCSFTVLPLLLRSEDVVGHTTLSGGHSQYQSFKNLEWKFFNNCFSLVYKPY